MHSTAASWRCRLRMDTLSGLTRIVLQSVAKQGDILQPISCLVSRVGGQRLHARLMVPPASPPGKDLDGVRETIRFKHYSRRTEQVYVDWIKRFILFHGKRHPEEMGAAEIAGMRAEGQ